MLNSTLQDYRSKHLHGGRNQGTASHSSTFLNDRAGPYGGTSRGPPRKSGRGGHKGIASKNVNFKKDQRGKTFFNFNKPSGSDFKKSYLPRDAPHAANLALPSSLPPPAYSPIPQDTEKHFAFETVALIAAPPQDGIRESGTKSPYADIEDPQDPIDTYPPSKKRRIDDKSKADIKEPTHVYQPHKAVVDQPHKANVDLKNPTDAIVIQDGDIDPNLVVSFSDNESIDVSAYISDQQFHESWVADMCLYYREADSLPPAPEY
jgi:hypothetical protein